MLRPWLRAFGAVLIGNAIYFALLLPRLPLPARHEPFHLDLGLLLDAALCAAAYLAILRLDRPRRP